MLLFSAFLSSYYFSLLITYYVIIIYLFFEHFCGMFTVKLLFECWMDERKQDDDRNSYFFTP